MTKRFTLFVLSLFSLSFTICKAQSTSLPRPDHIIVLIEENQPNSFVIGNSAAPYINQLTHDSVAAVFTQAFAIEHPSQPDYLDFFAGSNQGVLDDNVPANYPFTTPNLARELLDSGLTFATYSQQLPSVGYDGASNLGYVRKHNPVTNWVGTGTNQVPGTLNLPYDSLPANFDNLPTICYIVPNEDSDMHNGFGNSTISAGDYYMQEHLSPLINYCKTHNSLFIYTFDEDDGVFQNNIPTVFYGQMVKGGNYSNHITLYDMLRTLEDIYHLGHAGNAATATPITNCWRTNSVQTGVSLIGSDSKLKVYPNPASDKIQFEAKDIQSDATDIAVTDISGRTIGHYAMSGTKKISINTADFQSGLYFYQFTQDGLVTEAGRFSVAH